MAYSIARDNFALVPAEPVISNIYTLYSGEWSSQQQSVSMESSDFYLKPFQLTTVNIPPEDMSDWADNGVYVESEDFALQRLNFRCTNVPSTTLTFTVTQTTIRRVGDFIGEGYSLIQYVGDSTTVRILDGVADIRTNAFKDNSDSVIVYLPKTLRVIESEAFKDCTALNGIVFRETMTVTADMFDGCTAVTDIILDVDNGTWTNNVDFTFTEQLVGNQLDALVDKLFNYSSGTHTLKIGSLNKSRMSAAKIAAAEAKNWTVI